MRFVPCLLENDLAASARRFPALILTGSRRGGKTTLLRRLFPSASYWLVEAPDFFAPWAPIRAGSWRTLLKKRPYYEGMIAPPPGPLLIVARKQQNTSSGTMRYDVK